MNISGAGKKYYQSSTAAAKNTRNTDDTKKAATDKTEGTQKMSEAEEMAAFKKAFYDDLSKVTNHATVKNAAVNISDAAWEAMKKDTQYREKVLSLIQRDWGSSYAPRNCSVLITVGATLDEYRGDSWPVGYDSAFHMRSQNSSYKRTGEKKNKQKKLLKEYLEKRLQAKKVQQKLYEEKAQKQQFEQDKLLQLQRNKTQMTKASNAYEESFVIERKLSEKTN